LSKLNQAKELNNHVTLQDASQAVLAVCLAAIAGITSRHTITARRNLQGVTIPGWESEILVES
jgi:hypothetical protein